MKFTLSIFLILLATISISLAQLLVPKRNYTMADTLRGNLSPERTCYDIQYYHLTVQVLPESKSIIGSNEFKFKATRDFNTLQFDLFSNLQIDSILFKGKKQSFTRKFNAVFLNFKEPIPKNALEKFTVYYQGKPIIAKQAPWDGGLVFSKDTSGNDWISVACQGLGASVWWPNKDHQSDEVQGMKISIISPSHLQEISNGTFINQQDLGNGFTLHNWEVKNPINNYDVTFYIGKYSHYTEIYQGQKGPLHLDFWALNENLAKAKPHWDADVKPMLKCFEHWFGPYPFYEDGYKLVEAPFLGMEHQSAIAYGNKFQKGYMGSDLSKSGWGLKWDFITIHESGHEWFGNNITAKDIADMWIHESFTNYAEALFTECQFGKEAGQAYVQGLRGKIENDRPIMGDFNVNNEGSGDMYYKGANMIHNIRQIIADDAKFRALLIGLNKDFYHKTVSGEEIKNYINKKSGKNFDKVFSQYLEQTSIPELTYYFKKGALYFTWKNCVPKFDMPIKIWLNTKHSQWIYPINGKINSIKTKTENLKIDPNFYIKSKEESL